MKEFVNSENYIKFVKYYKYLALTMLFGSLLIAGFLTIDIKITAALLGISIFLTALLIPLTLPNFLYKVENKYRFYKLSFSLLLIYTFIFTVIFSIILGTNGDSRFSVLFKLFIIILPAGLSFWGLVGLATKEIFLISPQIIFRGKSALVISFAYIAVGILLTLEFSKLV